MKCIWKTLFLFLICVSTSYGQGDVQAGATKSAPCVACHGEDGNSVAPLWPKLAGQYPSYFIKQIKAYKQGEKGPRHNPQMYGMVTNLSEQDIMDLAAYYASLTPSKGKVEAQYLSLGEKIYRGGLIDKGVTACIACHGPKGLGNELAGFPRVSGQHSQYSQDQLKAFSQNQRANDYNGIMRDIASKMNEDEMLAVSEYMQGLH